jgi:hypothetical protein
MPYPSLIKAPFSSSFASYVPLPNVYVAIISQVHSLTPAMPIPPDFSFRRAVSAARARDYDPSPAIMSSKDSPNASPPPTPSLRPVTTLIPIYTSDSPQSAATQAASLVSNTLLTSTPTASLEPVSIPPLASKFFPQATNPLWIPSLDQVPLAWKPSFEQKKAREEVNVRLMLAGLFVLPILFVLAGIIVR